MCINSQCIGPAVSGGTCGGLIYKFLSNLLRLMQHLPLHCIYTCRLGAVVRSTPCPALQVYNACILMTLYPYYPGYDARMGAAGTLVSCYIGLCRV